MNINQLNSRLDFLFIILMSLLVITSLTLRFAVKSHSVDSDRLSNTQTNLLEGWTAGCLNWTVVEKYELINSFADAYDYCKNTMCIDKAIQFNSCWKSVGVSMCGYTLDALRDCILDDCMPSHSCSSFKLCENITFPSKPYIRYWNESVCVKETLVREVNE